MEASARAAVFSEANQPLEMEGYPLPHLAEGEVLVRITCCTVCGSDLHTYTGRRSTPAPTILGHEILGEVAELGPGAPVCGYDGTPLEAGDRVTWSIMASCGQCFFCTHEIPQKCESLFKYGHERITGEHAFSGGLAEYCHLAAGTTIIRVPGDVPDEVACPANCATATVAGALRTGGGCEGEVVLIQGAGMLGLTACAMANASGAREVICCDVNAERLALAAQFGATRCVNVAAAPDGLREAVMEATEGRGVDLAVELSGAATAMEAGLDMLRIGGRYVFVGAVFPGPAIAVNPETVVRRMLTLRGLHNYMPQDLAEAVRFLAGDGRRFPFADLVGRSFPLSDVNEAFGHALTGGDLRVAVRP